MGACFLLAALCCVAVPVPSLAFVPPRLRSQSAQLRSRLCPSPPFHRDPLSQQMLVPCWRARHSEDMLCRPSRCVALPISTRSTDLSSSLQRSMDRELARLLTLAAKSWNRSSMLEPVHRLSPGQWVGGSSSVTALLELSSICLGLE